MEKYNKMLLANENHYELYLFTHYLTQAHVQTHTYTHSQRLIVL